MAHHSTKPYSRSSMSKSSQAAYIALSPGDGSSLDDNWSTQPTSSRSARRLASRWHIIIGAIVSSGVLLVVYLWSSQTVSPKSATPSERVHLVFPLDKRSHGSLSCKSLLAACINGYEPVIVNWDLIMTKDELYAAKIPGVYDYLVSYLRDADPSDLVVMADSYDLWLQLGPKTLAGRFHELDAKIVIGADEWCWPNKEDSYECTHAPPSPIPLGVFPDDRRPQFANSGDIMGRLDDMRDFYHVLNDSLAERPYENDQTFFNEMLATPIPPFKIDYWYRLFWTTAGPGEGVIMPVRQPADFDKVNGTVPTELLPPLIYEKYTGELPVAVHYNMDATKYNLETLFGKVWWTMSQDPRFRPIILSRLENAYVHFAHDRSKLKYSELCPNSILDLQL